MEVIAGCRTKAEVTRDMGRIGADFKILPLNEAISYSGLSIFQEHHLSDGIDADDSLIAGTAIHYSVPLYGRNEKHFRPISGLKFKKPY